MIKKLCLAVVALLLSATAMASLGDKAAFGKTSAGVDIWRVTSSGHLIPGTTTSYSVGDATHLVKSVETNGMRLGYTSVSANTTLTTSSAVVVASTNATAVITLQNATTAGAGYRQDVINAAGSGNVSIASTSLIGGDASVNATVNTTRSFISSGSTWRILK